jgi:signal transduction histidine kinase
MLVIAAIVAIVLLDEVLHDLSDVGDEAFRRSRITTTVSAALTSVEGAAARLRDDPGPGDAAVRLMAALDDLRRVVAEQRAHSAGVDDGPLLDELDELRRRGEAVVAARGAERVAHAETALASIASARTALAELGDLMQTRVDAAHLAATNKLRRTALGLGLAFLLLLNVSILLLLRAATMILRPVDELIDATRHLAQEDFGYRIESDRTDEFGELARASNRLAEQLQMNEDRKLEALKQMARTLSHELNNALSVIELQLAYVERAAGGKEGSREHLQEIHQNLRRMATTIEAMTRIRRIVLTDYIDGVKMLDLDRSVEADEAPGSSSREESPTAVSP